MKKLIFLTLLFIFFTGKDLYSQSPSFFFQMTSHDDLDISNVLEYNNNLYFVSTATKPDSFFAKSMLVKINKNGEIVDSITFKNQNQRVYLKQIITDTNDSFIVQGIRSDTSYRFKDCSLYLIKIDTALNILDSKTYYFPSEYQIYSSSLQRGKESTLLIVGSALIPTVPHMFLYKFNNALDSLRAKFYIEGVSIWASDIKELNNGNFWVLRGIFPYYAKIDSSFNLVSAKAGQVSHFINANNAVKWDTDTTFYLAGDYMPGGDYRGVSDHDIGFIRQYHPFDSTGSLFNSWGAKKDTFDFPALHTSIDYQNKDSIFIGGTKNLGYGGAFLPIPSWYVLMQTDSMLNIRWEHFYGGDAHYIMTDLYATKNGGCIMAGTRWNYVSNPYLHKRDIYILKVNSDGLLTTTDGKPSPIVHNAIVYPNPGNEVLHVKVAAQYKQSLLRLFDMNGRLVLEKEIREKSAVINTAFLPKGTYVYKITGEKGLYESGKWVKE